MEADATSSSITIDSIGVKIDSATVSLSFSREVKDKIKATNAQQVLKKLAAIPVTSWKYHDQPEDGRHIGPMSEDFHSAFGLGSDKTGISVVDLTGVALASIQALNEQANLQSQRTATQNLKISSQVALLEELNEEKDREIRELRKELANQVAEFRELRTDLLALRESMATLIPANAQVE